MTEQDGIVRTHVGTMECPFCDNRAVFYGAKACTQCGADITYPTRALNGSHRWSILSLLVAAGAGYALQSWWVFAAIVAAVLLRVLITRPTQDSKPLPDTRAKPAFKRSRDRHSKRDAADSTGMVPLMASTAAPASVAEICPSSGGDADCGDGGGGGGD